MPLQDQASVCVYLCHYCCGTLPFPDEPYDLLAVQLHGFFFPQDIHVYKHSKFSTVLRALSKQITQVFSHASCDDICETHL